MAHVAIERKLAHDKNASANVGERAVHFIVFIAEHPQPQHLFSQLPAKRRRIVRPNAKQNQKASSDFSVNSAVNGNTGGIHAGNDCFHSEILSFCGNALHSKFERQYEFAQDLVGAGLCSARQDAPVFTETFSEFTTAQRADVGIGPYKRGGK